MISNFLRTSCLAILFCSGAFCQDASERPGTSVSFSPAGTERFARGGWSSLSVNAANRSDGDRDEVVSVYVGDELGLQFSKRFWLPARSKRQTWLPILIPRKTPKTLQTVPVSMMRLDESSGGEGFAENHLGMPISSRTVMLSDREINTGVMIDRGHPDGSGPTQEEIDQLINTIYAARDSVVTGSLDLGLISLSSNFLPPTPNSLDQLDQLVIASDRILGDTSGLADVRAWLQDGGRVWIMLDKTSEEVVTALLGDDACFTTVDRVELNEFQLDSVASAADNAIVENWQSEIPVEMLRVVVEVDDVPSRIDGWPAAFWQTVGQGEVLFTTVSDRGWMQGRVPAGALHAVSRRLFEPRERPVQHSLQMIPILDDQIGYKIASRRHAGIVLGLNAIVILVAGVWWARGRRLERLALLVPVSALTATAILLLMGSRQTASVPSTVATGQIVRVVDAVDEAKVSTVRAIYSQDAGDLELVSSNRTLTMPQVTDTPGEIRRILWEDSGRSRWVGSGQPPGVVRYVESESTIPLARRIVARGTFDSDGFSGTIDGLESRSCSDGLIVAAAVPSTATTFSESNDSSRRFQGGNDSLLAANQFIPGALLSNEQRMRQEFLRRILALPEEYPFTTKPSLLLWTDRFDVGVDFAERFEERGSALMSIPILVERPTNHGEFQIPPTFIRIETFVGSRGISTVFNPRTGRWLQQLTKPNETELLCKFPKSLLPMSLTSTTLKIKIDAPSRFLVIKAMVDGQPTEVYRKADPSGVIEINIDRGEALQLDAAGGLWLSIGVTETQLQREAAKVKSEADDPLAARVEPEPSSTWQIDYIHVSGTATCQQDEISAKDETVKVGEP